MSRFLVLGTPLEEVIRRSTVNPATQINRPALGSVAAGNPADIAVFEQLDGEFAYRDVEENEKLSDRQLPGVVTMSNGTVLYDRHGLVCDPVLGDSGQTESRGMLSVYPNPFSQRLAIACGLADGGRLRLSVYRANGQRIRDICDEIRDAGRYEFQWDGTDDRGAPVSSGVYLIALRAHGAETVRRSLLLH